MNARALTPLPHGFECIAQYEATWASGRLTTYYVKDAEIAGPRRKLTVGRARGKKQARGGKQQDKVSVPGVGRKLKSHVFDLTTTYYAPASLFRVLPRSVAKSFKGVATPYHYLKAGPVIPSFFPFFRLASQPLLLPLLAADDDSG
jgi:hypothetical protein